MAQESSRVLCVDTSPWRVVPQQWQNTSYTTGPEAHFGRAHRPYSQMDVAKVPPPSWITSYGGLTMSNHWANFKVRPGRGRLGEKREKDDSENASTASGPVSVPDREPELVQPTLALSSEDKFLAFDMFPSKGSAGHSQGKCMPCHYVNSKGGCAQGEDCVFCHMRHQKRNTQRVPRTERYKCLTLVQAVYDAGFHGEDNCVSAEAQLAEFLCSHPKLDSYATAVLRSLRRGAVLHGIDTSI